MEHALRLFPGYSASDLADRAAGSFLLSRLLEDGDRADLLGLFARWPEPAVAAWFAVHGGRQLSRRSRAFWQLILDTPAGPSSPASSALWPL